MFLVGPYSFPPGTVMAAIERLGLTTSLQVCLDAGDASSYDGTSQTWTDVSGNGNHFVRGTTSSTQSSDPTFNGTSGNQTGSEYFSHDGGDWFTLNQSAPSWQSSMHKSGAKYTVLMWQYVNNISSPKPTQNFTGFGDEISTSNAPSAVTFSQGGTLYHLQFAVLNETALVGGVASALTVNNNAWNLIGVTWDINANEVRFQINDQSETSSVTFTSPSSTNSHVPLVIGAVASDGGVALSSGCRTAACAIWSRVLTDAERLSFYDATRVRFGL